MTLGENHPEYASALNNMGLLYTSMDEYAKAEPLFRQRLKIIKTARGDASAEYATTLCNLAQLYGAMGKICSGRASLTAVA